jgi:hypothetical protein
MAHPTRGPEDFGAGQAQALRERQAEMLTRAGRSWRSGTWRGTRAHVPPSSNGLASSALTIACDVEIAPFIHGVRPTTRGAPTSLDEAIAWPQG